MNSAQFSKAQQERTAKSVQHKKWSGRLLRALSKKRSFGVSSFVPAATIIKETKVGSAFRICIHSSQ
ncbi:hypothetical protein [Sphingobacterium hotanense]|uniref:hypothetical protein n=1 Tax=Sphingobacterium hotanense TaxID=649196 RepID=UPI0011F22647|nr:hypothetical protein [Sphingobacterium hotanense]